MNGCNATLIPTLANGLFISRLMTNKSLNFNEIGVKKIS